MTRTRRRVVIVGGNFAGLVAASRLSCDIDVTVVDPGADFEWTPNIHEILSGVKNRDAVVLSRESCVRRYGHSFVQDTVVNVDHASDSVVTEGGLVLPYDACLVAAGSERTTYGIEGAEQYAVHLRRVDDAGRIARRLDKLAARKRRASVVIVGGGVSGIEALGEILRRRASGDEFNVHVVELESRVLSSLPEGLARDVERNCEDFPVTFHTGTGITEVGARSVTLDNGDKLGADLTIWSAGMALPDALRQSGLGDSNDGWMAVDDTLVSSSAKNLFAAGDCASLPTPLRKQAYYAMDTGELAGDNMRRFLGQQTLRAFRPSPKPMLISFGDITTWMVAGNRVVASPLLAAAKEGVYQATMARLMSPRDPLRYSVAAVGRATLATRQLLLPQLTPAGVLRGLTGGRIVA